MAVRPQHMHDGGIVERRLRPIYDWLDLGNSKKALQEAEKVLKKTPSLQAARALKALSLLRLGKSIESHAVLETLAEEKPSDDTTLQAMTICYRESQQLDKVCALYEAAIKVEPSNEELHTHLFMSYVRVGDYKAQQRVAMALYKFAPKNPYYFWAVMSIVLQAKEMEDPTKRGILLSLAQRMVENFITENKIEAEQEARLYIMILELQEKWTEILKFLESPLYNKLVTGQVLETKIKYLQKVGEWRKLNILCKELLIDHQDRWDYLMPYLDSVFQLMKEKNGDDNTLDDTAEKCHEFICLLVENMSQDRQLRGPYLARLELYKRLSVDQDASTLLGNGVALCVQYLRVFGNKPSVMPDLRPYLFMLPQKAREDACRDFLTCLGFDENSQPDKSADIQRHVNCLGAWRLCSPPPDEATSSTLAQLFRSQYLRCLAQGLVTSTTTEFCPADQYAVLAAHHYYYLAEHQKSSKPIMEALSLLELVLNKSPANFHVKLLLVRLYHIIGNALAADAIYQKLDIKHVQLSSLGWLHASCAAPALAMSRALQLHADARSFHMHHNKDGVEYLTFTYKYGTFEKLGELNSWADRLKSCVGRRAMMADAAVLSLAAGPGPLVGTRTQEGKYTDNRDLNIIVSWQPPQCQPTDLKERTLTQEIAYVELKECLVNAINACSDIAGKSPDQRKGRCDEIRSSVAEFKTKFDACRQLYSAKEKISISTPFPCRIIALVNSPVPYRELYSSAFTLLCEMSQQQATGSSDVHEACREMARLVEQSRDAMRQCVDAALGEDDPVWHLREVLEHICNYVEFLGVITYVLTISNDITSTSVKKSKKKTNQTPDESKTTEMMCKVNENVQKSIENLEKILEKYPQYNVSNTLEQAMESLNLIDSSSVESRLKIGRNDMLTDVQNILKKKGKHLKSLQH